MGAEDFAYMLQAKPGATASSATATAATARCGHGGGPVHAAQPELRLQRRPDPAGRHLLGAAGRALAGHAAEAERRREPPADRRRRGVRRRALFAQATPSAPSSSHGRARAGLGVESKLHPLHGPRRRGRSRWTSRATAQPTPSALLIVSSACHGVEGFCGSGVQVALLRDAAWREHARATRGVAVLYIHALNPYGFSHVAAHDARERRPEPQLPRLRRAAAGQRRLRASCSRCCCPTTWPPTRPTSAAIARLRRASTARARLPGGRSRGGQYEFPDGLFFGGTRADLEQPARCARCCATTAARCGGIAWIDLHTGLGPSGRGRAHLRRAGRRRRACPRPRRGGAAAADARDLDLRRLVDLGVAHRPDVAAPCTRNARRPSTPASRSNTAPCR